MFKTASNEAMIQTAAEIEKNYTIQRNDILELQVYTNRGERILDQSITTVTPDQQSTDKQSKGYLVDKDGFVKFPLIDTVKIDGLTIRQAEELLQKDYTKYYQEPFVILKYSNKRVTVLGAAGGHVIPLENENVRLTEILAMTKGIANDAKVHNIRILRNEQVLIADLSTIDGYKKSNYFIYPNDIIYIEPIRRPFFEATRDFSPAITIVTGIGTLILLIISLNQ